MLLLRDAALQLAVADCDAHRSWWTRPVGYYDLIDINGFVWLKQIVVDCHMHFTRVGAQ